MRLRTQTALLIVSLAAAGLCCSGCVYTSYTGKDGVTLKRISLFGNQSVGHVDLTKGTIEGYTSEQAEVAAAVAAGVAKGLTRP